jgi:hypothetical protein
VRLVTTAKKPARRSRRGGRARRSEPRPAVPAEGASETALDTFLESPTAPESPPQSPEPAEPVAVDEPGELPETSVPEPYFASRVPAPEPPRPLPSTRRAIFFDVENSSKAEHVSRVLAYLRVDRTVRSTDIIAVGNWRVIGHDTARLLAKQGANLVHSAPSVGVRDWSDLRIAVAAGVWLAGARPADTIEIISDDQAFDAVGDVASSLGVMFHRLSYRALAGVVIEVPREEPATDSRGRRRRRGGRGRTRREPIATRAPIAARAPVERPVANGDELDAEAHTAPHDELLAVARDLIEASAERSVGIDALSNALKGHGFRRTPGSPRLITRLRRIKELEVGRTGTIRLVDGGTATDVEEPLTTAESAEIEPPGEGDFETAETSEQDTASSDAAPAAAPRRRRRRGGRRRRGRGNGHAASATT